MLELIGLFLEVCQRVATAPRHVCVTCSVCTAGAGAINWAVPRGEPACRYSTSPFVRDLLWLYNWSWRPKVNQSIELMIYFT